MQITLRLVAQRNNVTMCCSYNVAGAAYDRGDVTEATRHYERVLFLSGWGLGFGVWGLGFGVWGLGFEACASVHAPSETYQGSGGGGGVAAKTKERPKETVGKRISQMSAHPTPNFNTDFMY